MINVYDLSNATLPTLFGMLALWAAASKRHWFVRTAVVVGAILFTLLIPAYEVAILLSVQILLVVVGMAMWWHRRSLDKSPEARAINPAPFRLQLSMETLLLAVVIVAVATAVLARMPRLEWSKCYLYTLDGFISAKIALVCVWIVCGRARWWWRAAAFPLLAVMLAFELVCLQWAGYIAEYWLRPTTVSMSEYLKYAGRALWPSTLAWTKPVSLGMVVLCLWLYCARRAGWFDPFGDGARVQSTPPRSRAIKILTNTFVVVLLGIVSIFPLALLYGLMHPTPIPPDPLPSPNGYDDLLAAGNMIGPTAARTLQRWDLLTVGQLRAELAKHQRAFDRMYEGLQKPCRVPYVFRPWPQEYSRSLIYLWEGNYALGALARRTNNLDDELEHNFLLLRLAQEEGRGDGADYFRGIFPQYEKDGYRGIWNCAPRLSAGKCIELVTKLREIEARRESWEDRLAIQRAIEDYSGWEKHLERILIDWSGEELEKWKRIEEWRRVTQLRMLIVKLALHAYQLENSRLPETLDELVPKYLPKVPIDPFGGQRLHYRRDGEKYILYSCGPDEDDDGGAPREVVDHEELGDMTDAALFNSPVFEPYIGQP